MKVEAVARAEAMVEWRAVYVQLGAARVAAHRHVRRQADGAKKVEGSNPGKCGWQMASQSSTNGGEQVV